MPSKTSKPTEPKKPARTAKATKPAVAKKAPALAAKPKSAAKASARTTSKPLAKPTAKPTPKPTIADTVRAVVDAAAAIVGAAVTVNAAVGPRKGRTARTVGRALEVAEGVTAAAVALVDLNRAAPDALASLKHIGPKRAQKIVESRPFQAVDELVARKLLPRKAVEELRGKLSV